MRLGKFQDLKQLVGIGFQRTNKQNIVDLFVWDYVKENELKALKAAKEDRESIVDKKYCHIVYLCELFYRVMIGLNQNISRNPGCEWKLRYYGNSTCSN